MILKYLHCNTKFLIVIFLVIFGTFIQLSAEVVFSSPDLNAKDDLLFTATHTIPGEDSYSSLFSVNLEAVKSTTDESTPFSLLTPKILTCYPQTMQLMMNGKVLQVQNRYGTARYYEDTNQLIWINGSQVNSFDDNTHQFIPTSPILHDNISVSPNGKYTCFVDRNSASSGRLVIRDNSSFSETVLDKNADFDLEKVHVEWSPDSSFVIYEKEGYIYFASTSDVFSTVQLSENYRQIGVGNISNVYWASNKLLVYIQNDLVYTIGTNEMYTRAIYSNLVGIGKLAGRLPYSFTNNRDKFWTNSDCTSLVLLQDNKTVWYLELKGTDTNFIQTLFSYPFVNVPGATLNFDVFWTPSSLSTQLPILWVQLLRDGKTESYVYKLKYNDEQKNCYFSPLPLPVSVGNPKLSPDGKLLAFTGERGMHIYDISLWKQLYLTSDEKIISYVWIDSFSLFIGGRETVRKWNIKDNLISVLFLSSAQKFAWDGINDEIIAQTHSGYFSYQKDKNVWTTSDNVITRNASTQNPYWRVFLGTSENRLFSNALYVRFLSGTAVTKSVYPETNKKTAVRPKIAITFDALDNASGLTTILSVLDRYGIKSTFFINGEFLRRYASSVEQIVKADHECASLFYTMADLFSTDFTVDEDFIRRGLARNEDEFYSTTGKELALFWHTVDYKTNDVISRSGNLAGYKFVSRGLAPKDYVTLQDAIEKGDVYQSSAELVENIVSRLENGKVIPISVGISQGSRTDYLYEKLDILIYNIIKAGYDIVTVSELHK